MKLTVDMGDDEARELLKQQRPGETYREFFLRLGGVDAPKRKAGRPSRFLTSLDIMGRPGFIPATDGSVAKKELAEVHDTWQYKKPKKEGE